MKKIVAAVFAVLLLSVVAASGAAAAKNAKKFAFQAMLSGAEIVPAATTEGTGAATFQPEKKETAIRYSLKVKDIENVTAAHIHTGAMGVNGPPVVNLFTGPKKEGKFSGKLATGTITAADLHGALEGKTVADLVRMMRDGELYVNVHTDRYPDGEIRGQIKQAMMKGKMKGKGY